MSDAAGERFFYARLKAGLALFLDTAVLCIIAGSFGSPWMRYTTAAGPTPTWNKVWLLEGVPDCSTGACIQMDLDAMNDDAPASRGTKVSLAFVSLSIFLAFSAIVSTAMLLWNATSANDFRLGGTCGRGVRLGSVWASIAAILNAVLIFSETLAWAQYIAVQQAMTFKNVANARSRYIDGIGLSMVAAVLALFCLLALWSAGREGNASAARTASSAVILPPGVVASGPVKVPQTPGATGPVISSNPLNYGVAAPV